MEQSTTAQQRAFTTEDIARVCHEANRAICLAMGDNSQVHWTQAEQWQKESAMEGVRWRLENPFLPASSQHDSWMKAKIADGWVFGLVKDLENKIHPCLVPYHELPAGQQLKDHIFTAIVMTFYFRYWQAGAETEGGNRVILSFNPSKMPQIDQAKSLMAFLIDLVAQHAKLAPTTGDPQRVLQAAATAKTELEKTAMVVVKSLVVSANGK